MRLPNGYGSVHRLSNYRHRRRPYVAKVTSGYNDKKQPKYTILGYYQTKQEGLEALSQWFRDPTLRNPTITFGEAADKAFEREKNHLAESTVKIYRNIYIRYLKGLEDKKVNTLRIEHIQEIIDQIDKVSVQSAVKTTYRVIENYCLKFSLMNKGFASLLDAKKYEKTTIRVPFTRSEIEKIWADCNEDINKATLILLYTGMRIEELRKLKARQIDIESRFITCGSKTAAGKNRLIPIHPKIMSIIVNLKNNHSDEDYILPLPDFRRNWEALCCRIGYRHVPHECRHTLRSELDRTGANKVCIDRIMGHVSLDVGERIYTHKTRQELLDTILKVTY